MRDVRATIGYMDSEALKMLAEDEECKYTAAVSKRNYDVGGDKRVRVAIIEIPPSVLDRAFMSMTDAELFALVGYNTNERPTLGELEKLSVILQEQANNIERAARKLKVAAETAREIDLSSLGWGKRT